MKKLIYGTLFLTLVGIGFVGCKKEKDSTKLNQNAKIEYRLDKIPLIKYSGNEEVAMKSENDADEEKLNLQLFELAVATKDLIKDYTFVELIVRLARESNVETVYYSEIKEKGLSFYNLINQKLALKGLSIESITANMTHQPIFPNPEFPETGGLEIYEPSIFVPNVLNVNPNLQALISPNIETEYNEEDYILAWFFDGSGVQRETILNESTATKTANPILILNHSIPKVKMDKIGEYVIKTKGATPFPKSGDTYFESTRIKIKSGYRYEQGTGKSEFCIGGAIVHQDSPPANFLHLTNNNDYSLKIKEVTKNEVNNSSNVYVTSHHSDNYTPYSSNKVYWNTFERDWNRSWKSLGNGTTFGQEWMFWGRMRYNNDWYQWIPSTVNIHATPFEWFAWETEILFSSWKSEYNLVKVN
jgi:hypothetical protein